MLLLILLIVLGLSNATSPSSENLAMQVIFTHGLTSWYTVESEYSIMDNTSFPSQPIHNLVVSSSDAQAFLWISVGNGSQVWLRHTGNAWVLILDPSDGLYASPVYPPVIGGGEVFLPEPVPTSKAVPIRQDGLFIMVVPVAEEHTLKIRPPDLFGSLGVLDASDPSGAVTSLKRLVERYVGNQLVSIVVGRFVPSTRTPISQIEDSTEPIETDQTDKRPEPQSLLQSMAIPSTVPFTLAGTFTWNLSKVSASGLGGKTNNLAFIRDDFTSGAGISLSVTSENAIKLTYEQFGLANVLVFRPNRGLVFPDAETFCEENGGLYFAWENAKPTEMADRFLPGDLVAIVIPLKENWKATSLSLVELLSLYAGKCELFDPSHALETVFRAVEEASEVFISISTIVPRTAMLSHPINTLPTIESWPRPSQEAGTLRDNSSQQNAVPVRLSSRSSQPSVQQSSIAIESSASILRGVVHIERKRDNQADESNLSKTFPSTNVPVKDTTQLDSPRDIVKQEKEEKPIEGVIDKSNLVEENKTRTSHLYSVALRYQNASATRKAAVATNKSINNNSLLEEAEIKERNEPKTSHLYSAALKIKNEPDIKKEADGNDRKLDCTIESFDSSNRSQLSQSQPNNGSVQNSPKSSEARNLDDHCTSSVNQLKGNAEPHRTSQLFRLGQRNAYLENNNNHDDAEESEEYEDFSKRIVYPATVKRVEIKKPESTVFVENNRPVPGRSSWHCFSSTRRTNDNADSENITHGGGENDCLKNTEPPKPKDNQSVTLTSKSNNDGQENLDCFHAAEEENARQTSNQHHTEDEAPPKTELVVSVAAVKTKRRRRNTVPDEEELF